RTSGSSCATTGSPTASSNPTTISSTIVVRHGTSSSISLGASCPTDCANGPTGSDQWDLVLCATRMYFRNGMTGPSPYNIATLAKELERCAAGALNGFQQ